MSRKTVLRLAASAVVGAGLAAAGLTPQAHADTNDAAFLATLKVGGITYPNAAYAIRAGHFVCALFEAGKTRQAVYDTVAIDSGLDWLSAPYFVGASTASYCPQFNLGGSHGGSANAGQVV